SPSWGSEIEARSSASVSAVLMPPTRSLVRYSQSSVGIKSGRTLRTQLGSADHHGGAASELVPLEIDDVAAAEQANAGGIGQRADRAQGVFPHIALDERRAEPLLQRVDRGMLRPWRRVHPRTVEVEARHAAGPEHLHRIPRDPLFGG